MYRTPDAGSRVPAEPGRSRTGGVIPDIDHSSLSSPRPKPDVQSVDVKLSSKALLKYSTRYRQEL